MQPTYFVKCRLAVMLRSVLNSAVLAGLLLLSVWFGAGLQPAASSTGASSSNWIGDPVMAEARLISAVSGSGDLAELPLGLEIRLAPGWKIYWRTAGEAGLPPVLDFSQSANSGLKAEMSWPVPRRFNVFGFDNFGYEEHVVFPVTVSGHASGGVTQIKAGLEALVCADICVPLAGDLDLQISDGAANSSAHARVIAEYSAMVPRRSDASGMAATSPNIRVIAANFDRDVVRILFADGMPAIEDIFVEGFEQIAFKAPVMRGNRAVISYLPSKNYEFGGGDGRITVVARDEFGDYPITITPANDTDLVGDNAGDNNRGDDAVGLSLWALGIAFLGGLILNLMPCVLPVLALKLTSVIGVIGRPQAEIRRRFIAGAAGILTSFIVLASVMAGLKIAGASIGWGIQFQNVYFIGGMILLLGLFTASLFDLVTFRVPAFAQKLAGSGAGASSGESAKAPSLKSDFFSGMLATILATPCSAPFVGTAVGIAFAGSITDLYGIFIAMGFGLAAPWLLVAMVPSAVTLLPRPGPWFKWLRTGLALMLVGTMIWLGTIFITLAGANDPLSNASISSEAKMWRVWTPEITQQLVADGKIVFVDVTADWCVTCKANKALVLDQQPVAGALAALVDAGRLVQVRADWTRPSDEIAAFLASHSRFGIPFNVIYAPGYPGGIVLPELLRADAVLSALDKASEGF